MGAVEDEAVEMIAAKMNGRDEPKDISTAQVLIMAFSVGAISGNIYYIQPLLSAVAASFQVSVPKVGMVAMCTQLGMAIGMLLFVPLGDSKERRKMLVNMLLVDMVLLVLMATAHNYFWLAAVSLGIGICGSSVHLLVPFAAELASPARRGRAVGIVFSGLLLGVLLARTLSGFVGAWFGWRAIYWIAAVLMPLLALMIRFGLPKSRPETQLSWVELIQSSARLVRDQPILRESALLGSLPFCAFSAFWTTLVFYMETPPYHYGSDVTGLFGLIGATGALTAPLVGRFADRYGARRNVIVSVLIVFVSFLMLYFLGHTMLALIAAVILLDYGVQSSHVANQTRIYSLVPEARSRLNMAYMIFYFTAGSISSFIGSELWYHFGWAGVCGFGCTLALLCCVIFVATRNREQPRTAVEKC